MAEIRTFKKFQDFLTENQRKILTDYFPYYDFLQALKRINNEGLGLFDSFNVVGKNGESIFCVWTENTYYIYGEKWDDDVIAKALERIEPQKFKNYTFLGQRHLINNIFKTANIEFERRRNRIVYNCRKIRSNADENDGVVLNASRKYVDQLVRNGILYYREEFEGKGSKSDDEVAQDIISSIEKGSMYCLLTSDTIQSIVTVINYEYNRPMIGSLFTRPESRNKGYAYKLLYEVTRGLLENDFSECGLLSNADNPASNKIFKKIGYEPIYDLVIAFKKERE